jgi:hypothetical protein
MAYRHTIDATGDGGAAAIVASLLVVALIVVGFFFYFGSTYADGSQTIDIDVPAMTVDVTPAKR